MTDRKWKVGDRVVIKRGWDNTYPEYASGQEYTVEEVDEVGDPKIPVDGNLGWFFSDDADKVFDVVRPTQQSELDAIERDFKDLFDRMRAEIERLK